MNYLEHEYLVPVVLGGRSEVLKAAKEIYKISEIKSHIFADSFTLRQKWSCICHKVRPMRDFLLLESLCSFSDSLEEYYFPVLISCDKESDSFIQNHKEELECRYVIIDSKNFEIERRALI